MVLYLNGSHSFWERLHKILIFKHLTKRSLLHSLNLFSRKRLIVES